MMINFCSKTQHMWQCLISIILCTIYARAENRVRNLHAYIFLLTHIYWQFLNFLKGMREIKVLKEIIYIWEHISSTNVFCRKYIVTSCSIYIECLHTKLNFEHIIHSRRVFLTIVNFNKILLYVLILILGVNWSKQTDLLFISISIGEKRLSKYFILRHKHS